MATTTAIVRPSSGSDIAGDGSYLNPYGTIQQVITNLTGPTISTCFIELDTNINNAVKETITYTGSTNLVISSHNGNLAYWYGSHTIPVSAGWVNTTGNIWKTVLTGTYPIVQLALTAIGYAETISGHTYPNLFMKWNSTDTNGPAITAPDPGAFGCVGSCLTPLTTGLTAGQTGITTLAVGATPTPMYNGDVLRIGSVQNQMVTLTADAPAGSTTLSVTTFTSTYTQAAGVYCYDQTVPLYVQMPAGENPNGYQFQMSSLSCGINAIGTGRVDYLNIAGWYFAGSLVFCGATNGTTQTINTARNCDWRWSEDGVHAQALYQVLSEYNCVEYRCANDGFNIHGSGNAYSTSSIHRGNGNYPSDSAQPYSNHDNSRMFIIGGEGSGCTGGGIVTVDSAYVAVINDANGPLILDNNLRLGGLHGTSAQGGYNLQNTATGRVDTRYGNTYGIVVTNTPGAGVKVPALQLTGYSKVSSGTGNGNTTADVLS